MKNVLALKGDKTFPPYLIAWDALAEANRLLL